MPEYFHFELTMKPDAARRSRVHYGVDYSQPDAAKVITDYQHAPTITFWRNGTIKHMGAMSEEIPSRDVKKMKVVHTMFLTMPERPEKVLARQDEVSLDYVTRPMEARQVFVVHGRNTVLRDEVCKFLEALGLIPLSWRRARELTGEPTPYVLDIVHAGMNAARAILVLMTAEDHAALLPHFEKDDKDRADLVPRGQPRQNVLVEAGMAIAAAGRERTILVQLGETRPLSDLEGLHLLRLTNDREVRKDLASRLEDAGCLLDKADDWEVRGDFEGPLPVPAASQ